MDVKESATSPDCGGYSYVGGELPLFENAQNWKRYFRSQLKPFIGGVVAEIGAGVGGTTAVLSELPHSRWYAVEPDARLLGSIEKLQRQGRLPPTVQPLTGGLEALTPLGGVETILYVDVLEHIADDKGQLEEAANHLRPGGRLIVLSPAYQSLFTAFDAAIGHHRRYTKRALRDISPPSLKIEEAFYLDSIGVLASLANKFALHEAQPTLSQILFWDRVVIPLSMVADRFFLRSFGRSVIMVWQKC
jgi:SAM-dependent methyltransferase